MRITYGPHALDILVERGLDRAWIERTILAPEHVEADPRHPERVRAFRTVPERDGRTLRVVHVPTGGGTRVVTAFLDRSRRRPP